MSTAAQPAPRRPDPARELEAPPRDATPPAADDDADDELDLDLEEADDGDRLKEGFTGQER